MFPYIDFFRRLRQSTFSFRYCRPAMFIQNFHHCKLLSFCLHKLGIEAESTPSALLCLPRLSCFMQRLSATRTKTKRNTLQIRVQKGLCRLEQKTVRLSDLLPFLSHIVFVRLVGKHMTQIRATLLKTVTRKQFL